MIRIGPLQNGFPQLIQILHIAVVAKAFARCHGQFVRSVHSFLVVDLCVGWRLCDVVEVRVVVVEEK